MSIQFENDLYEAISLHYEGKPSVQKYLELIKIEPNNSLLLYLLASAYYFNNNNKQAKIYYNKALKLNSNIDFSENFANYKDIIKKVYGTIITKDNPHKNPDFEKPLNLKPIFDSVYSNVASLYRGTNDLSNAIRICEEGLKHYPESRFIKWIYGGALLKTRFMSKGWEYFNDRVLEFFQLPEAFKQKDIYNFQKTDKPVYIHYAGGLGDTVFFARYLPLLNARGIKYISKPQASMKRLFLASGLQYNEENITENDFEYRINFMGLAGLFETSTETIPFPQGYMNAATKDILLFKEKYFNNDKKKIGIVWNTGKNDNIRKIELKELIPLFKNKKCQFYSLQHEITEEERFLLNRNNVINIGETFSDWEDTAAALANLDLYIGVDTSVSNLAGAMGVKSYILVLDFCEWRWGINEETTPWFLSTKVYRQKKHGDWQEVIKRLKSKLP